MSLDEDRLSALALKVWQYKQGEVVSLMVHLGDRLGLYKAMDGAGPFTAEDLAARTGLKARWVLEWLRGQAAAGLIDTGDGLTFEMGPEAGKVLADDRDSIWFAAGAFGGGVAPPEVVDRLADAFSTGIGLSYDDLGPSAAHSVERMLEPWTRLALVPVVLAALGDVVGRLSDGAAVADVGCGSGVAVTTMAQAFPLSRFDGYDPSHHAIARARARADQLGLTNVSFSPVPASELPGDGRYDLVVTLDCLHDMPDPVGAARAIRASIDDEGVWLIKEIRSSARWADQIRNPVLALLYGTSVSCCMSSALSEPGGAGLGTLGLPPEETGGLCRRAGFTRFTTHDFDDPGNLYYEVRP